MVLRCGLALDQTGNRFRYSTSLPTAVCHLFAKALFFLGVACLNGNRVTGDLFYTSFRSWHGGHTDWRGGDAEDEG